MSLSHHSLQLNSHLSSLPPIIIIINPPTFNQKNRTPTGGNTSTPTSRDLKAVLEELPERRDHVLEQVATMIQKMLVKDLAGLPFVQVGR